MIPLTWTPRWYCAGISLWALAARIAFVSTASILTVLEYLVGATRTHRAPMWFGSQARIARVGEELGLPLQSSADTFCSSDPLPFAEREHYRLALRWCDQCLANWYHSPDFQDARVSECPTHRTALLERCPTCKRFVDPLSVRHWRCPECRQELARAPADWLENFITTRGSHLKAERSRALWQRADAGASMWWIRRDAMPNEPGPDYDLYGADVQLFEYLATLWECVAGDHRDCARTENFAALAQHSAFEFQCPVAAAFLQAGVAAGVEAEPRGEWPSFRRWHFGGWRPSHKLPPLAAALVRREQLRLFVLSALTHLGAASRGGWSEALWSPEAASLAKTTTSTRGIFVSGMASDAELLKACRAAAESCKAVQRTAN